LLLQQPFLMRFFNVEQQVRTAQMALCIRRSGGGGRNAPSDAAATALSLVSGTLQGQVQRRLTLTVLSARESVR